jgi:hypothetical protein
VNPRSRRKWLERDDVAADVATGMDGSLWLARRPHARERLVRRQRPAKATVVVVRAGRTFLPEPKSPDTY